MSQPAPLIQVAATVVSSPDPQRLAGFYERLLGWNRLDNQPGWIRLVPPTGGAGLSFQHEADYAPPAWPQRADAQQMMMHLDIATDDLDAAIGWAEELGARPADHQPRASVRVMLDPDGHPFCLFTRGS